MAGVMTYSRSVSMRRLVAYLSDATMAPELRTVVALAACLFMSGTTVAAALRALRKRGEAHVSSWVLVGPLQMRAAVWSLGAGVDAPRPGPKQGRHEVNPHTSPGGRRVLVWFSAGGRGACAEVAAGCALTLRTAQIVCRQLHAEGVLRIVSWRRSRGGAHTPVYGWRYKTSKADAPRLQAMTRQELVARRRDALVERFGEMQGLALWRDMTSRRKRCSVIMVDGEVVYRRRTRGVAALGGREVRHGA